MTHNDMMFHLKEIRKIYHDILSEDSKDNSETRRALYYRLAALDKACHILNSTENFTTFIDDQMTITRDAIDRATEIENRLHAKEREVHLLQLALATTLDRLSGGVMISKDAPVDRLTVDETIDGDILVKLRKEDPDDR